MVKSSAFFLWCLLLPLMLTAQVERSFELNGVVNTSSDNKEGIAIINISTNKATVTDSNGAFSIEVIVGDTLELKAVQFVTERFVVKSYMKKESIVINPTPKINELKEVTVMPYNLSGNIGADLGQINTENAELPFKLGIPNMHVKKLPKSERLLREANSWGPISPFNIPINPILNAISGRTKKLKRNVEIEKFESKLKTTKEQFDTLLYVEAFKIPKEKIDDFIYYCAEDTLFNSVHGTGDKLKMLTFLKKKSEAYRTQNNLD